MDRPLSRYYGHLKLRWKLLLIHLGVLGLSVVIIAVFVFVQVSETLEEKYLAAISSSVEQLSANLSYRLQLAYDTTQVTAWDSDLQRIAGYRDEEYPIDQQVRDIRTLRGLLSDAATLDHVHDVRLYLKHESIHTRERQRVFPLEGLDTSAVLEVIEAEAPSVAWTDVYTRVDGTPVVSCVRPIRDPDYVFRDLGFVVLDVPIAFLKEAVGRNQFLTSAGPIGLLRSEGLLTVAGAAAPDRFAELVAGFPGIDSGVVVVDDYVVVTRTLLYPPTWTLAAAVPRTSLHAERSSFVLLFVLVLLVAGAISVVFLIRLSRRISSRLEALTPLARDAAVSAEPDGVEDRFDDEITELKRYLVRLVRTNSELVREVYREKMAEKEAEMRALQVQINPHFLYNTLDAINWKAAEEEAPEVGTMVGLLAKFYRNSLHNGEELVAVSEEIEHVRTFIEIYKHRLGDALSFTAEIDPRLLDRKIPRLTLQPLVENAVQYGVQHRAQQSGVVRLGGCLKGHVGLLLVDDDGPGFSRRRWSSVMADDREGFAIKNVDRRLKAFFGEEYGLSYDFSFAPGTRAVVRFPVEI
jgi:two-component system sensor histidine kinase YesM